MGPAEANVVAIWVPVVQPKTPVATMVVWGGLALGALPHNKGMGVRFYVLGRWLEMWGSA